MFRKRVWQGFDANNQRFKPLSASYVRYRQGKLLSSKTSATKSNVTLTGQMVEDTAIIAPKDGQLEFKVKAKSSDKARYNMGEGKVLREYIGLTPKERKFLEKEIRKSLVKALR